MLVWYIGAVRYAGLLLQVSRALPGSYDLRKYQLGTWSNTSLVAVLFQFRYQLGTSVGLVYRLCPSICTGINTGIANPISLVSIHLVPVECQRTLSVCILPKTARDPTRLVLGFKYQSAYQCCVFRVAFSPGINLAMIMCFKSYPFSYFELALKSFHE